MSTAKQVIHRFFADKHGKIVIAQFPNPPIIGWFIAAVLAHFVRTGFVHAVAKLTAAIALLVWAVLEIVSGVSPFRRVLGGIVLAVLGFGLIQSLA